MLCVGIGGGGDVAGALAVADLAERFGAGAIVGGLTWERRVIDPIPGARTLDELDGLAERLNDAVGLAGPDTTGPGGFRFAESHLAGLLGEPVVLVDPNPGPAALAAALDDACVQLECDRIALVDVGGDVLAEGHEAGLGSPLADAIVLAAAAHLRTPSIGAIWGTGCDGELTIDEVLARVSALAAAGDLLGTWGPPPAALDRVAAAVEVVPTEASAQALAAARGATGSATIRGGRRTVQLGPVPGLVFCFDPVGALASAAPLAQAVRDAASLEDGDRILAARGVRTELAYEREHAA